MLEVVRAGLLTRRLTVLFLVTLGVVVLQGGIALRLLQLEHHSLAVLMSIGLLGQFLILGLGFYTGTELRTSLQQGLADTHANSELLEELQKQRDGLARVMAERAKRDVRLRLLESAVVNARDAVIILEAEPSAEVGRSVLYVNEAFTQITGYEAREVIGRSLHFLRGPRSDSQTLELLRQAMTTKTPLQTELLNYRKDGSEVWVELNLVPVYDPQNGSLAHWVMIQRDASDRKQAEQALRYNEERLRAIYDNTNAAVVVMRPNGDFLEVNAAFGQMLGYATEELTRLNLMDLTHPDDHRAKFELFEKLRTGKLTSYNFQARFVHNSRKTIWVDLYCHVMQNIAGEPLSFIGVLLDITERKQAQEALRRSEEGYRLLFDFNPQPMWVLDRTSFRFLAVNEAAIRKYGYSRREFLALTLTEVTDWEDQDKLIEQHWNQSPADGLPTLWKHRTKHGQLLHVEVTANNLSMPSQTDPTTLMLMTDVTEKQRLEEQLRQSQKMEGIGQLAGGIAHDFNNLLTAIVGNLALIELSNEDANRPLVQTAERAAQRAAELTRKLLGFARRNQLLLSPVQVTELISEVFGLLKRTFDPRIDLISGPSIQETILADATLINQALLNLCLNSRDAMPNGGSLKISAELVDVDAERARHNSEARVGSYVRITVEDTGTGMSPEVHNRIFEPFFTTKPVGQGTGLGLPMVHGILKQHHGWVHCESSIGQGTKFELYLPRVFSRPSDGSTTIRRTQTHRELPLDTESPQYTECTQPSIPRSVAGSRTILLVDDEEMIREIARHTLESAGYSVKQACDGLEAVEIFRDHHDSIDLVLLDLTMPRLSGRDAFEQLQAIDPNVQVMFASGYSTDDLSDLNGAMGLLPKPYRPNDLLNAVNNVFHSQLRKTISCTN